MRWIAVAMIAGCAGTNVSVKHTQSTIDTGSEGRCSNGYLPGTGACTGSNFDTLEGCRTSDAGFLVGVTERCGGDTPVCLSEGGPDADSSDDDVAGCCPSTVYVYDPDLCVGL